MLNRFILNLSMLTLTLGAIDSSFANTTDGLLTSDDAEKLINESTQHSGIVSIPNDYSTIGFQAFTNPKIERIIIPDSITSVSPSSFDRCANAKLVVPSRTMKTYICNVCDNINQNRITVDLKLTSKDHAWKWPIDGILNIPNDIKNLENLSFVGRNDITSIEVPNNINSISGRWLSDFDGLTSITIPHWTYITEPNLIPSTVKTINVKYVNPDMIGHGNRRIIQMLGDARFKTKINFFDENGNKI